MCVKQLGSKSTAVECSSCESFYHSKCVDIDKQVCDALKTINGFRWLCHKCNEKADVCDNRKCGSCKLIPQFLDMLEKLNDTVDALKQEISTLKKSETRSDFEEIVSEVTDRINRKRNLMVFGVAEPDSSLSADVRSGMDFQTIKEIVKFVSPNINDALVENINVFRVGRLKSAEVPRPIKVELRGESDVRQLLKQVQLKRQSLKSHLTYKSISITMDRTARQQSLYKEVKAELDIRRNAGEKNISIKYVKGIPQISSINLNLN